MNPVTFTHLVTRTATSVFPPGRNNFWNQGNALELCTLCSNAFVQAIALALSFGSAVGWFPDWSGQCVALVPKVVATGVQLPCCSGT
ncbi:hypothetical protein JYQ62_35690 [Nostoc sp. UHCC 0702]|nr:hypothetical protein JYQ62_35690 [Nostoc sp. UHCC 0702]